MPPAETSRLSRARGRLLPVVAPVVLALLAAAHAGAQTRTVATDKAALVALYNATGGADWTTGTNWTTGEALSSWHGVTTDGAGRVTQLALSNNGLSGTLPAALGDLDELERLDLSYNALRGALPAELADLTSLTTLSLTRSRALSGPLPDGLRNLADLATVQIADTELCAPGDDTFQAWWRTIAGTGLICPPATDSVIEVAVFYTPAARDDEGGTTAIEDEIDTRIAETNSAYRAGGVKQKVELVAVAEVDYSEVSGTTDLNRLISGFDGHMDEVHAVRDRVGADIVMLVRRQTDFLIGGRARQMTTVSTAFANSAFGTVNSGTGGRTFAHELGHIMGLHHDRYVACTGTSCAAAAFPYAYGYHNCAPASFTDRWRTIMAYANQCTTWRTPLLFSNPEQNYRGAPAGIAGLAPSNAVDGPSDAVRTLNRTRAYVANFRQAPDITVSFGAAAYTAAEGGTAATVAVKLSAAPTRTLEIPLSWTPATGATAAAAHDFDGVPAVVRFGATDTEQTFTVTAADDAADESDETITLTLGAPTARGATLGSPSETTVTLTDDDTVTTAPGILGVEVTSDPGPDRVYAPDDVIEVSVRFDKTVTVTGSPQLELTVGSGATRQATYRDSAGDVMRFTYTVTSSDGSIGRVSLAANSLTLNGGTIKDGDDQDAAPSHDAIAGGRPYDADSDGLIEITTLAQLAVVGWDLDGDGEPTTTGASTYQAAFPGDDTPLSCIGGCEGYELAADLDFDTNGNGTADSGDTYWNNGLGWAPIGPYSHLSHRTNPFRATFDGNGHTIANLYIDRTDSGTSLGRALFGGTTSSAVIRNLGLVNVDVRANGGLGGYRATALVGNNEGTIRRCYATGRVSGANAAGLVGVNDGTITASYAAVRAVGGEFAAGGLAGTNDGTITASFATGRVSAGASSGRMDHGGGLVGRNGGTITASYATGPVSGASPSGGLAGTNTGTVTDSYWDTTTSGRTISRGGTGKTTAELQTPTGASGIYASWNVDVDGDGTADDPWDFGTDGQYPVLKANFDGEGSATWQEFGRQLRAGPTLTATADGHPVALSWTVLDVNVWSPVPALTYNVTRDDRGTVTVIGEALGGLSDTDVAVPVGSTYIYQVAAVIDGGEWVRSAPVSVLGVAPNQPPQRVGTLAARTLSIDDPAVTLDVSGAFSDPEDDALTYAASSSVPAVATATISGSTVTVTPLAAGVATITVTATDAGGSNTSATQTFVVTVPNRAPVAVGTLADRLVEVSGGVFTVPLSGAFQDPDGDDLTYGASSSAASVASATVSGSAVAVTPLSGGTATITVTATDASGSNTAARQTFDVTVANRAPVAQGTLEPLTLQVPDVVTADVTGAVTVDVSGAFEDPDRDALTYSATVDPAGGSVATVSVDDSKVSQVTVTPVSGGAATVTVRAEDPDGLSATQPLAVTVENRPPVATDEPLAALSLEVPRDVDVELSGAFEDPDGDALTYAAESSDTAVATVSVTGSTVTVKPESRGTATVSVTATDVNGSNTPAERTFAATVANRSPVVEGTLPALTRRVGEGEATVELSGAFSDPDGDALTYGAESSSTSAVSVSVSGSTVKVRPRAEDSAAEVTVTATDGIEGTTPAEQAFTVTVPANAGPEADGTLEDKALDVTGTALTVDVSGAFSDPDRDVLTYGAESSNETVASVSVAGSVVTLTPENQGTARVTVTARDAGGSNTPVEQGFGVTVGGNRSPEPVGTLPPLSLRVVGDEESVEVSSAFRDRDDDTLTYAAASNAESIATVSVSVSEVTVTAESSGTARITVTARDADGSDTTAAQPLAVTVANQPPEPLGSLPPLSLRVGDRPEPVDVSGAFEDPESDALTYGATVVPADGSVVTVTAAGSTVTVTAVSGGTARITVTARDAGGSGMTAERTFEATVANRAPVPLGRLPALTLQIPRVRSANVSAAFSDPDGDELTYAAVSSAPAVAAVVEVSGSTVRVEPRSPGSARVTVTAQDAGGLRATQAFAVTVANRSPLPLGTLPALDLQSADGAVAVDVSGAFADLDGDALTFGASSSAVTVAAAAASGSVVAVTPLSQGTATVTVTATDVDGSNTPAMQAFAVSVDGGGGGGGGGGGRNRGPEAAGTPAERTLEVGESLPVDVSAAFLDRDGDVLTYAAESSAPDVAAVSVVAVASGVVTVTGLSEGEAQVTVTATDADGSGRSATQSFRVAVSCGYAVEPLHRDVLWPAGTGAVTVATGSTCAWTAAGESAFLTLTGGASGTGPGTVTYAVAANAGGPRTGVLTVAGQRVTVFQASPAVFADHPLERGVTPVRAIHFRELRARVDASRVGAGLGAFAWTDPALTAGTRVRSVHLTELRTALAGVYAAAGRAAPTWSYAGPAGTTVIRAAHLMELRAAVTALEQL